MENLSKIEFHLSTAEKVLADIVGPEVAKVYVYERNPSLVHLELAKLARESAVHKMTVETVKTHLRKAADCIETRQNPDNRLLAARAAVAKEV